MKRAPWHTDGLPPWFAATRMLAAFVVGSVAGLAVASALFSRPDVSHAESRPLPLLAEEVEEPVYTVASLSPLVSPAPIAPQAGFVETERDSFPAAADPPIAAGFSAQPAANSPPPASPQGGIVGPPSPGPEIFALAGVLAQGETLASSLEEQGVSPGTVHLIAEGMSPVFDFRYSHAGDQYQLVRTGDETLLEFQYAVSPFESYRLFLDGERYVPERRESELRRRPVRIAGIITTSLYDAVKDLGENPQLASDFADVFAWDVDFTRAVQAGDEFQILYERLFRETVDGQEVFVGPGRILAARYRGYSGDHAAVYFEREEGRGGYFRPDGSSVERQFLRAPVKFSRISSNYSHARMHPILKVRRPHLGIDYAAPTGTPVWTVADGKVIFKGWSGGFGKLVKVRHNNGYVSYYGHLSRYADDLAVGSSVSQKQVVGYVGSTGLATGPHVDFRIKKDGKYMNPAHLHTPPGRPISAEVEPEFQLIRNNLLSQLDARPLVAVGEAL